MSHILIIGGTNGLGNAIAKKMDDGTNLISLVGRKSHLHTIKKNKNILFMFEDLFINPKRYDSILKNAFEIHGGINHLIFCQRIRQKNTTLEEEMNFTVTLSRTFIDNMKYFWAADKNNSILFTGSLLGKYISQTQDISYHISKASIDHMTKFYAVSLGPKGIRVNNICPYVYIKEETEQYKKNQQNGIESSCYQQDKLLVFKNPLKPVRFYL